MPDTGWKSAFGVAVQRFPALFATRGWAAWVILLPTIQGLALLVIVLDVLVIYGLTVAKHAQA